MKILGVGAGPAALYFSILMKQRDPSCEIALYERNGAHQTFGWGVVFSDETLGYLEENDSKTYAAIAAKFAHWDAIDVCVRGRTIRSGGHGFSGIARRELLQILETRARELGVVLHFDCELTTDDILRMKGECDLLLAADGIRSVVRGMWHQHFQPEVDVRKCKYIWLGTTRLFDAFTFLFAKKGDALFQVHAYRFDENHSTFIVECDEDSWRTAGYDTLPVDDAVRELQTLFADDLHNAPLLTNRSAWNNFATIRNKCWHFENVVLIGDAAHTAHFSIGSGTKLAMEDAIALAKAFEKGQTVASSLEWYETERRPVVERTQWAAQSSLAWFENTRRYWAMEPEQLAFSLLTRSKKVTWDNLGLRDREYAQQVGAWFARAHGASGTAVRPPMFVPFRLREMTLHNRVVVSPMCMYSAVDGVVNDFHLVHYGARAQGGAGLVVTEMTDVSADARITYGCAGMYKPEHVERWSRIVTFVHQHTKAKIALQLGHAGRKGATCVPWQGGYDQPLAEGSWPLMSASAIPYLSHSQTPRAMTRADMDTVRDEFVGATVRAEEAGFDMVELHMAHGYLLASFLSPLTNQRSDEYGNTIEGRAKFPLEVFDAMRTVWPQHKPMSVRVSAHDWAPGGTTDDDMLWLARALKSHGCDILDVSTGQTVADARPVFGRMYQAPWSDSLRNEAEIPTMTVGNISSHDQVNTLVTAGRADLCVLARPHLSDPFWTLHAAEQQGFEAMEWPAQYVAGKGQWKK
jgi:anthraniloyl-CoA monooxygenase